MGRETWGGHRGPFPPSTRAYLSFPLWFMESHGPHDHTTNHGSLYLCSLYSCVMIATRISLITVLPSNQDTPNHVHSKTNSDRITNGRSNGRQWTTSQTLSQKSPLTQHTALYHYVRKYRNSRTVCMCTLVCGCPHALSTQIRRPTYKVTLDQRDASLVKQYP